MTTEQIETNPEQPMGPGPLLRKARKDMGLEVQDVADKLHLRASVITDLEQNKFNQNVNATFIRGYLRSYARLVNLPGDQVVRAYDALRGEFAPAPTEMQSYSGRTKKESNDNMLMMLTYAIFALLVVGTFIWWWQSPTSEVSIDTGAATEVEEVVESETDLTIQDAGPELIEVEPAQPVQLPEGEAQSTEAPAAAESEPTEAASTEQPEVVEAPEVEEVAVVEEVPVEEAAPAAALSTALSLDFTGECWLEIRDATGKIMVSGTYQAGRQMELDGEPPYKLVVGAPQNVTISYQGEPLQMREGRVARLTVPNS